MASGDPFGMRPLDWTASYICGIFLGITLMSGINFAVNYDKIEEARNREIRPGLAGLLDYSPFSF